MYVNRWQTINMAQSTMHKGFEACYVNRLIDLAKKVGHVAEENLAFYEKFLYLCS